MFEVVLYRHQNSYEKYILTCTPASYAYAVLHSEQRKNIQQQDTTKATQLMNPLAKFFIRKSISRQLRIYSLYILKISVSPAREVAAFF